jgi:YHS domain-containing protein
MNTANLELDAPIVDPICGRFLAAGLVALHYDYRGRRWHFCSDRCRQRFLRVAARIHADEVARLGALFDTSEKVRWGQA